jgi:hypothetical protein
VLTVPESGGCRLVGGVREGVLTVPESGGWASREWYGGQIWWGEGGREDITYLPSRIYIHHQTRPFRISGDCIL